MTIEGITRMAKQAGFADEEIDNCQQIFIHFAMLVAEHERDSCAKVCDDWSAWHGDTKIISKAIRARGQA